MILSDDGYGQRGTQVPRLDATTISHFDRDNVWRAKRIDEEGVVRYWDGLRLYAQWDGMPCYFDFCD